MLKQTLLSAVVALSLTAAAQAQTYTLSTSSSLSTSTSSSTSISTSSDSEAADYYFNFDSATGVLEIDGTIGNDTCVVYTYYGQLKIVLAIADGKEYYTKKYGPTDVSRIVFHGGDGDDTFRFYSTAMMSYYNQNYGWFDIDCDLYGEGGCDSLSGGIGDDVLIGGFDYCDDILIGNAGSDLFVRSTHKYQSLYYTFYAVEFEDMQDLGVDKGDQVIYDYQLDALLAQ